jgi:hypothetical protein
MNKSAQLILSAGLLLSIASCTKRFEIPSPVPPKAATIIVDSTTAKLIGQTWVYYEYFTNFDSANTNLVWKTNRTSNTLNLALDQVKYNADNTYSEIDQNGTTFNGTWSYTDSNRTGVSVVNSLGTFVSKIQLLDSNRFEWLAPNGTYGVMVPKNQAIDTTGGRMALLTSKTWVYTEYFHDFSVTAPANPGLVWKTNKSNSTLNLSLNVVKFNADGSYTETDQFGNIVTGTWSFLNNQTETQVINSQGTFTSIIKLLDTNRFEWVDIAGGNYGEMVPQ